MINILIKIFFRQKILFVSVYICQISLALLFVLLHSMLRINAAGL